MSGLEEVLAGHGMAMDPRGHTACCDCGWSDGLLHLGQPSRRIAGYHAHLAAVLEPYVQQRVGDALEGAAVAVTDLPRPNPDDTTGGERVGYMWACEDAARIIREAKS